MTADLLEKLRVGLANNPGVPAGFVTVALAIAWADKDGGTDPLVWLPGTLLIVGLLVVVAVAAPGHVPGGTAGIVAIAALAAFTAWCFISIAWADVRADAWTGANRTLAYFAIYTLLALRPWRARPAAALLGFYSLGTAAVGLWTLLRLDVGADPGTAFIAGRLVEPISYANANCALFVSAAFPALFLSSRRETPFVLRGLLLASVGVLVELASLCQSRMSLLATPVVLVAYFAFTPGRLRSVLSLAIVAVAVVASRSDLLEVFTAVYGTDPGGQTSGSGRLAEVIDGSQRVVLLSAIGLSMAGIAWGLIDERVRLPRSVVRAAGVVVVMLVLGAGVAGSAVFAERYGSPVTRAGIWWDRFKSDEYVSEAGTSHLTSGFGGAGRYAIWTVSYGIFKRHPIVGTGVDTFGVDWARERPNTQDNIYPHSVELRTLQQTGLIGALLLGVFVAGALFAALRRIRRRPPFARGIAITSLLVFAYWCVHGSVDWLWEVPALSAAAFGFLGLGVALSDTSLAEEARGPGRRWLAPVLAVAFGLIAVATLAPPWLSAREVEAGVRSVSEPSVAYAYLERARSLNPFASEPDILASVIAEQAGDVGKQRAFLVRAIGRNPDDWFPHVQIALLDARAGDRASALRAIGQARRLNPRDLSIRFAEEGIRKGKPPTAAEMDALYVQSAATCCRP